MRAIQPKGTAILFDLDGTLVDSAPDLAAATNAMRADRGLPLVALADYRPHVGSGARGMLWVAFNMTTDHSDYARYRAEFFCNYERQLTQRTVLFTGVVDLLLALEKRGFAWGIVTNKSARFALPLVRHFSEFDSRRALICGDTTAHSKPHPAPLWAASKLMGYDNANCIYIGDDKRDMDAARAAGMLGLAATYGYLGEHAIADWSCAGVILQPLDLLQWLDG